MDTADNNDKRVSLYHKAWIQSKKSHFQMYFVRKWLDVSWVLFCMSIPQTRFLDLIIEPSRATLQLSKNQQSMINEILDFYDYYVSYKHVKSENRFL